MNNALYIAWRSGRDGDGRWGPVGCLERHGDGYRFWYTRGAVGRAGFQPFPGMKDLKAVYESDELFPLFANRLLATSRPEYEAYLVWGDFNPAEPPDPLVLLGVTEGPRATDQLEVFPVPTPNADGKYVNKFFLHGVRWMPEASLERIESLDAGEPLYLMHDFCNPYDRGAVAVRTEDRHIIGYVPRYLAYEAKQVGTAGESSFLHPEVARVNDGAPMQQRVLCRMTAEWPNGFTPCSQVDFQPIVELPQALNS